MSLFHSPRSSWKVPTSVCPALLCLSIGCANKNGIYCIQSADCGNSYCVGYVPNSHAGICLQKTTISSKQCNLAASCVDGSKPARLFGKNVAIRSRSPGASMFTLVASFDKGVSYCDKGTAPAISDISDTMGRLVPPGPLAGLSSDDTWISGDPTRNQAFYIRTSGSADGSPVTFPTGALISRVAASKSWLGVADPTKGDLWLWKNSAFNNKIIGPAIFSNQEPLYGNTLSVSDFQIAVGSSSFVHLYDISESNGNAQISPIAITRPGQASTEFGIQVAVSSLGLIVSENSEQSTGQAIWWYPRGSQEAQLLPIPARYTPSNPSIPLGYGVALAMTDTRVALGVPGRPDVVVLERSGDRWEELRLSSGSITPAVSSGFGSAVAMDGNLLAVGAPGEGSVYIYDCR